MLAKGLQIQIGDGSGPEAFTQITADVEIDWGGRTWEVEETTNHDSTAKITTRETTVTTDQPLSLTFKPWDPGGNASHALLHTLAEAGTARNFKIYYPGSSLGYFGPFEAVVNVFKHETPTKGLWAAKVTLTPTGTIADAAPRLVSVTVTDAQSGNYVTGETIELSATFDEVVKVTGTPRIAITLGSGTVYANYATGTGTNVLKFRHVVLLADDANAGQFAISSPISLNSGTIKDMIDQAAASLTFTPPTTSAFTVN